MKLYTAVGHLYARGAKVVNGISAPISKRIATIETYRLCYWERGVACVFFVSHYCLWHHLL